MDKIRVGCLVKTLVDKTEKDIGLIKSGSFGYVVDFKKPSDSKSIYLVEISDLEEGCPLVVYNESEIEIIK